MSVVDEITKNVGGTGFKLLFLATVCSVVAFEIASLTALFLTAYSPILGVSASCLFSALMLHILFFK